MSSSNPPIPPDEMAQRASALQVEVAATESRLAKLKRELAWHEEGIRLYGGEPLDPAVLAAFPDPADLPNLPSANGRKPTLRQAILIVMHEHPNKTWKVEAVISELRQREWLPGGDNAEHRTRSVLAQMHRKGQAKRIDRGRYRLPPEPKDDS